MREDITVVVTNERGTRATHEQDSPEASFTPQNCFTYVNCTLTVSSAPPECSVEVEFPSILTSRELTFIIRIVAYRITKMQNHFASTC